MRNREYRNNGAKEQGEYLPDLFVQAGVNGEYEKLTAV
jgi:hypothetical protein